MCYRKVGRAITKWGAIEKSPILLLQYWKNYHFLRVTKVISHFDGSNNIFGDCVFAKVLMVHPKMYNNYCAIKYIIFGAPIIYSLLVITYCRTTGHKCHLFILHQNSQSKVYQYLSKVIQKIKLKTIYPILKSCCLSNTLI